MQLEYANLGEEAQQEDLPTVEKIKTAKAVITKAKEEIGELKRNHAKR